MPSYHRWYLPASDGRWFCFDQQQCLCSCGPTSVKIIKELVHNTYIAEEIIRAQVALFKHDCAHTGMRTDQINERLDIHDWDRRGSTPRDQLAALKANPYVVPSAKLIDCGYAQALRDSSRNHPSLVSWVWSNGGGHANVCVGPLKNDPERMLLLDCYFGLQTILLKDNRDRFITFFPDSCMKMGRIQRMITT